MLLGIMVEHEGKFHEVACLAYINQYRSEKFRLVLANTSINIILNFFATKVSWYNISKLFISFTLRFLHFTFYVCLSIWGLQHSNTGGLFSSSILLFLMY